MSTLESAHAEHRAARRRVLAAALAVPEGRWALPRAPGKWTPAQVCEHLALADEAAVRELETGHAMRQPLPPWKRTLLRWTVLRWIVWTGRFPRALAPRETRPPACSAEREALLARLSAAGPRMESLIASERGGARFTHPYFGVLDARTSLRLLARHLTHHARQLDAAAR